MPFVTIYRGRLGRFFGKRTNPLLGAFTNGKNAINFDDEAINRKRKYVIFKNDDGKKTMIKAEVSQNSKWIQLRRFLVYLLFWHFLCSNSNDRAWQCQIWIIRVFFTVKWQLFLSKVEWKQADYKMSRSLSFDTLNNTKCASGQHFICTFFRKTWMFASQKSK